MPLGRLHRPPRVRLGQIRLGQVRLSFFFPTAKNPRAIFYVKQYLRFGTTKTILLYIYIFLSKITSTVGFFLENDTRIPPPLPPLKICQIEFLVPKDVHCSETYATTIFRFFFIFSFNKIVILSLIQFFSDYVLTGICIRFRRFYDSEKKQFKKILQTQNSKKNSQDIFFLRIF